MLPRIADVGNDRRQRHDLRLIRQVEDSIDVQHVQELRGLHEAVLHLLLVLLVGLERQVQQRLPIARDGRQLLALLAGALRLAPAVARVKQRDRLQEVGVR